jgi:antitoxin ParD1/3/4
MNVSLTEELETLVHEKVRSGMYHSASEVIRDALRLLRNRDEDRELRLADLRREIQAALDDPREPRPLDIEAIKAEGRRRKGVR